MQAGMVHALREIHRVLTPTGTLIDIRPHQNNRQVDIALSYATLRLGEIDSSRTLPDHLAADDAMQQAIQAGLFVLRHDETFEIMSDLDTVDDLRQYGASMRRSILPPSVIQHAEALTIGETDDWSIQIHRQMQIKLYERR